MTQWEYKTVELEMKNGFWGGSSFPDEERLEVTFDKMGILGWELVNAVTSTVTYGQTSKMLCIFKRQK